jgi:hypothetical protein
MKIKGLLFTAAVAAVAFSAAHAASKPLYYRCVNVGGVEEYTLEVNLNTGKAAFFDNDSWSVLPQTSVGQLESLPPQTLYRFEGPDAYKKPMRISFNQTRLSGGVTENAGTPKQNRLDVKGCQAVKAADLYSGI